MLRSLFSEGDGNDISGRPTLIFRPVSDSKGEMFVALWGVARYCLRNTGSSCFQFLFSAAVAWMCWFKIHMNRSASPLLFDHKGDLF